MLLQYAQSLSDYKVSITNLGHILKLSWARSIIKVVFFISNIILIFLYLLYHLSFCFSPLILRDTFSLGFQDSTGYWLSYQITGRVFSKRGLDPHLVLVSADPWAPSLKFFLLCLHLHLCYLPQPFSYEYIYTLITQMLISSLDHLSNYKLTLNCLDMIVP